jgi:hypothetical protein
MSGKTSRAWACSFRFEVSMVKNDQPDSNTRVFTRRQWLGRVPPSAIAAVLGAGLAGESGFASEQTRNDSGAEDLGARVYNIRRYGAKGDGIALDTAAVHAIDPLLRDAQEDDSVARNLRREGVAEILKVFLLP